MIDSSKPIFLSLNMTSEMMYENNKEYSNYITDDRQPMDTVFRGFNFPSKAPVKAIFSYPNGSIKIENVSSIRAMGNYSEKNYKLPNINIISFLRGKNPDNITDQEAYEQVKGIFKQLEDKGWEYNFALNAPRLTPENAVKYALTGGDSSYLDFRYPLTQEQFNQITSYIHRWYLRHGTDTFLEIEMWRNVEDNDDTTILFAYEFQDEINEVKRYVGAENKTTAIQSFAKDYTNPPFISRFWSESKVVAKDIPIDKSLTSYTFPLVKQKTGFDTATLINTNPYKITYEEFIKRFEAGEDMTPYYENQPKTKPEIVSKAKGRCPAGQPCPKSGYWLTPAKQDSRAYFKQGTIMPDYPNNDWGNVIWQYDGDKG